MRVVLALAAVGLAAGVAQANADAKFVCARGDTVRSVAVATRTGSGHACEVQYEKTSMGDKPQVLWHSDSDASFCADQAKALVDRLSLAGWDCKASEDATAEASPPPEPLSAAVEVKGPEADTAASADSIVTPASNAAGVTAAIQSATTQTPGPMNVPQSARQPIDPSNAAIDGRPPIDPSIHLRPTLH